MAYTNPIGIEEDEYQSSTGGSTATAPAETEDDGGFGSILASTASAEEGDASPSVDWASLEGALTETAEALSEEDTQENRDEYTEEFIEVVELVEEKLDDLDFEDSGAAAEIDDFGKGLAEKGQEQVSIGEQASSEDAESIIKDGGKIIEQAGETIQAVNEIADEDKEKGADAAEELSSALGDVVTILREGADPLEDFGMAQERFAETHTYILDLYEEVLGFAFLSAYIDTEEDRLQDDAVQRSIQQDNIALENRRSGIATTQSQDAAVQTGTLSAASGVDFTGFKLTLPTDHDGDGEADEIEESGLRRLISQNPYTDNVVLNPDGSTTFSTKTRDGATTENSDYLRSELREMLRFGNTSVDTSSPENNWVTSMAPAEDQAAAGGVDGQMRATLSVDKVTEMGDSEQAGRVIIGQIHAEENEPLRLYYHKTPDSPNGAIYFAHEPQNGKSETFHVLFGDETGNATDGIALGEVFSYDIKVEGQDLSVTIERNDGTVVSETVDLSDSGYDAEGTQLYFKAGVYSQNDTTPDPSTDYAEATFYSLETAHDGKAISGGADPSTIFPNQSQPPYSGADSPPLPYGGQDGTTPPMLGTDDSLSPSTYTGGAEALPPTYPVDGTSPTNGGTTPAPETGSSGGLSPYSSTDGDPSAQNQANLEARFITLYETLMEKQISFKEAVEAFKTDNQNAAKG